MVSHISVAIDFSCQGHEKPHRAACEFLELGSCLSLGYLKLNLKPGGSHAIPGAAWQCSCAVEERLVGVEPFPSYHCGGETEDG